MILEKAGAPLKWTALPDRSPGPAEVCVRITACGVCRTDLHVLDGELPEIKYPIIPGHEIVGRVEALGKDVTGLVIGQRVGVPWLGHTCGVCPYCRSQRENLCDRPLFTGYTRDGGFASATIADARFVFALGEEGEDAALAPLLCAGLIGWRSLVMAGQGKRLRALWLRRRRPYYRPGRSLAGPLGLCLHVTGRPQDAGIRAQPGRRLGRWIG